jgi:hypothetical protein
MMRKRPIFLDDTLRELPTNSPIVLENLTCTYCGTSFARVGYTKEHVIGRRFVPKGKLNKHWNLIVRACESCNTRKSDLEDDLSSIFMQPDNPEMRAFLRSVTDWEPRLFVVTADSYFKLALRRHPSVECWSWALEWNRHHRLVGFFGDETAIRQMEAGLPNLSVDTVLDVEGRPIHFRIDTPLAESDDEMFLWSGSSADNLLVAGGRS